MWIYWRNVGVDWGVRSMENSILHLASKVMNRPTSSWWTISIIIYSRFEYWEWYHKIIKNHNLFIKEGYSNFFMVFIPFVYWIVLISLSSEPLVFFACYGLTMLRSCQIGSATWNHHTYLVLALSLWLVAYDNNATSTVHAVHNLLMLHDQNCWAIIKNPLNAKIRQMKIRTARYVIYTFTK